MTNKDTYIQLFKLLGFSFVIFEKAETILEDNFMKKYVSENNEKKYQFCRVSVVPTDVNLNILRETFSIKTTIVNIQRLGIYEYQITDKTTDTSLTLRIAPSSILFNSSFENYRNELMQEGFSSIVTTKKSLFPETAFSAAIIISSNLSSSYSFSTITSYEELYNFIYEPNSFTRTIFNTKEIDIKNLLPEHYNPENNKIYDFIEKFNPKKLEDIADIIYGRGPGRWETNENDGIPVISIGSIKNGEIVKCTKFVNTDIANNYSKLLLEEGDILVSRIYGQNKICVVKESDLPAIASGFLIIVRPLKVATINIYEYLSSSAGQSIFQKQLSDISTGSCIKNIPISAFRNLQIPSVNKTNISNFEWKYKSSFEEIKSIANKALNKLSESVLEETIIQNLLSAGWEKKDISKTEKLKFNDGFIIPDITLKDNGKILAFIEVKLYASDSNKKIEQIKAIQKQYDVLAIISLGTYFEVYRKAADQFIVFKFGNAPTKKDLIKILQEEK